MAGDSPGEITRARERRREGLRRAYPGAWFDRRGSARA